jgi:hypothetical protein
MKEPQTTFAVTVYGGSDGVTSGLCGSVGGITVLSGLVALWIVVLMGLFGPFILGTPCFS